MANNTRKCKVCGKDFNIIDNDYVKYKNGFTEIECFKTHRLNKGILLEVINVELEELLEITKIEKIERSNKELEKTRKKIVAKNRETSRKTNLDNLIKYFYEVYSVNNFSNYFYLKLSQINSGTYKGMTEGISYEDILDMFKRKQNYLNKMADRNRQLGKEMFGISRVNYDLAIIINKYDEYKIWKNKQKILSVVENMEKDKDEINIDYSKFNTINKSSENEGLDIGDILDDIY